MKQKFRILHLSDLHLFRNREKELLGINPYNCLTQVKNKIINNIEQKKPDLIVLTGDVSQDFSNESYELAYEILKNLGCPTTATMGNHDKEPFFSQIFGGPNKNIISPEATNWHIVVLNSHWEQHVDGKLGYHQLKFLQNKLDEHIDHPIMIFLHHHILPIKSHWIDEINLNNSSQFLALIDQYKNIKAVVCGHVHQETHIKRKEVDFYTTPSTSWQFTPKSPDFKLDNLMPGYRWINLNEDGTIQTEVIRIDYNEDLLPDLSSKGY